MAQSNVNGSSLQLQLIRVEHLRLDEENPRLSAALEQPTQEILLKELYERYDLEPLLLSLSESGYFTEEPLIGVRKAELSEDGQPLFTIVEGNRRLAALKLLLYESDRQSIDATDIPEPGQNILPKLNPIPIKEYATRSEVVPYLGVRHIAGVKDWDALAKAKYIEWLRDTEGYTVREISRMVGNRGDVVRRWLLTLYTLNQANAEADEPWREADKNFKFSFLYTSLGYQAVRAYLGMSYDLMLDPNPSPVPPEGVSHLLSHMGDLYGPGPGDATKAVLKDSRALRQLSAVYESELALNALRGGARLEEAYRRSAGEAVELLDLLRQSSLRLDEAMGMAHRHGDSTEAATLAQRCLGTSEQLVKTLEGNR